MTRRRKRNRRETFRRAIFPISCLRRGVLVIYGDFEGLREAIAEDEAFGDPEEYDRFKDNSLGLVARDKDMRGESIIWFPKEPIPEFPQIAHEVSHAVFHMLSSIGIPHTDDTDEIYAYLIEYLTTVIHEWLNEDNNNND